MGGGSKGQKKRSLRDYSHPSLTTEEINALRLAAASPDQHSIVIAILCHALVEHELDVLLRRRFKKNDDETWEALLDERGPLRSFNSKIVTGYAFGFYNDKVQHDLHVIRRIRNAFAHSKKLLDFDDVLIIPELLSARCLPADHKKILQKRQPSKRWARGAYIIICLMTYNELAERRLRAITSPVADALIAGLGKPKTTK